ncbi:MAG: hypothetical protein P8X82_02105, partial [Gemmatimonadales bacterium]
ELGALLSDALESNPDLLSLRARKSAARATQRLIGLRVSRGEGVCEFLPSLNRSCHQKERKD